MSRGCQAKYFLLDTTFDYIKAHIQDFYDRSSATADEKSFMNNFYIMLHQSKVATDPMIMEESWNSILGKCEKFTKLTGITPPPMSNSLTFPINPTPKLATDYKRKNNVCDDERFILPSKLAKNLSSFMNSASKFETDNKFKTLSNKSDDCADRANNSNTPPPEPKLQLILMTL